MKQRIDYLTTAPTNTEMKTVFDPKTKTNNGYIKNTWDDGHVQVVKIVDDKFIDITKLYNRSYTIMLVGAVIFLITIVVGLFVEDAGRMTLIVGAGVALFFVILMWVLVRLDLAIVPSNAFDSKTIWENLGNGFDAGLNL